VARYYDNANQAQRFQPGTTVRADEVDAKFDQVSSAFSDVETEVDRSLKLVNDGSDHEIAATATQRRNKVVGFDASGTMALLDGFTFRGDFAASTDYFVNDVIRDTTTKNLFVVDERHVSGSTRDNSKMSLAIDVDDIETAKAAAQNAQSAAESAQSSAQDAQSYAEQWANRPEDSLITGAAGGDGVDDFSALHHANKAASSASAASTSESNAATSETSAQQAATDAETALDTFTDQYLGAKASDPATDNDGDPLQGGALYFNTTQNNLKIYSASLSSWIVVEQRSANEIRNLFSASGDISYDGSKGEFSFTQRTDSEVRNLFSASGDISYDSSTGAFSFTQTPNYTDSDVDAHLSGGTGVTYTTGTIAIGQDVGTGASVTFADAQFTGTGAVVLPDGTQAQRPSTPLIGSVRFNTDDGGFEGYNGASWGPLGGGATGGGSDQVFVENDQVVTANYTINAGRNASTTGPLEIADGVTVSVPDGSRLVVI
jgi:hypothetical protein